MSAAQHVTRSANDTFFSGSKLATRQTSSQPVRQRALTVRAAFGVRSKAPTQSYICKDCGYIYDERQSFESLDSSYRCPVCSAPKRRFTTYGAPVGRGANNTATRKERKEEMGLGSSLDFKVVIGIGFLIALGAGTYAVLSL